MSSKNAKPARPTRPSPLDALVREAREAPIAAPIDWEKVDTALFSKIEREAEYQRALTAERGRPWPWLVLGGVAAAAAAAIVMVVPPSQTSTLVGVAAVEGTAGDLAFQTGAGEVRVDGSKAQSGLHLRQGDSVETRGAKAVFDAPARVSWLLEDESKVRVERAGSAGAGGDSAPVLLALSQGALEAQVTPVASGEAFAVDVGGTRVAVHGTHLRVARNGDHVVVDLTEGVVSIGAPPKVGSTYGSLVMAPAHVEFQAGNPAGSLVVEHEASAIRGAVDIMNPASEETASVPVAVAANPAPHVEDVAPPPRSQARHATVARNRNAEAAVKDVVSACYAKYAAAPVRSSDPVSTTTVSFTTQPTLSLAVNADGYVEGDMFFNPVPPVPVTDCANLPIRKIRFGEAESGHARKIELNPKP
jgi:hypothetical protein